MTSSSNEPIAKHSTGDRLTDAVRSVTAFVLTLATLLTIWLFAGGGWDELIPIVNRDKWRGVDPALDVVSTAPAEIRQENAADQSTWRVLGHNVVATWLRTVGNGKLEPELVDRWEQSADGREWTFHLKNGLRWSDGSRLEAGDLVRSLQRNVSAKFDYADRLQLDSVAAQSKSTIVIKTSKPMAVLPHLLSSRLGAVWTNASSTDNGGKSKTDSSRADGAEAKPIIVTSGPYAVISYKADGTGRGELDLRPTASTLAADAHVDSLTIRWTDEATAKADVARGKVQYAVADWNVDLGKGTEHGASTRRLAIAFNGRTDRPYPALSDKKFRQGMRWAINSRNVLDAIGGGYAGAQTASTGVAPTAYGHDEADSSFSFDPDKATAEVTHYFGVYSPHLIVPDWAAGAGDVIKSQLNDILQYPHVEVLDQGTYSQRLQADDYDMAIVQVDGYDGLRGLLDANSMTGVDAPDTTTAYDAIFTAKTEDDLLAAVKNAAAVQSDWSTVDWLGTAKTSVWTASGWSKLPADLSDVTIDYRSIGKN